MSFQKQDILSAAALVLVQPMKTGNHPMTEKLLIVTLLKHQNKQTKTSQSIVCAGVILKGSTYLPWHITTEKWILC